MHGERGAHGKAPHVTSVTDLFLSARAQCQLKAGHNSNVTASASGFVIRDHFATDLGENMEAQLVAEPEKTWHIEGEAANAGAPVLSPSEKHSCAPCSSRSLATLK